MHIVILRLALFSLILPVKGYPTLGATQQAPPSLLFVDRMYGWSVSYPSTWEVASLDPAFVRIQQPPALPFGVVGIHSAVGLRGQSLDAFSDRMMAVEAGKAGFQVLSRRRTALSDATPALEVVNVLGVGIAGKSHKVFVLDGDRGLSINAETYLDSFPTLEPYFDRIIKSFTIRGTTAATPRPSGVQAQPVHPLPSHALIAGVPFISWGEAAKLDYHDKQILNPSVAASQGMVLEYWGQDRRRLAKTSDTLQGWTSAGGEGGKLDSIRSYVARGIPIVVNLAMTPAAHPAEPNAAALATLIGSGELRAGSNLTQQQWEHAQQLLTQYAGISSGVLGKMADLDTLRRWGDLLGQKIWQESVLLTSRVVVGYDDERKVVVLHDPSFGPAWEVSYGDFERMWGLFDHASMLMYPPDYAKVLASRSAVPSYAQRTAAQRAAESFVFGYALASTGRLAEANVRLNAGLAVQTSRRDTATCSFSSWHGWPKRPATRQAQFPDTSKREPCCRSIIARGSSCRGSTSAAAGLSGAGKPQSCGARPRSCAAMRRRRRRCSVPSRTTSL